MTVLINKCLACTRIAVCRGADASLFLIALILAGFLALMPAQAQAGETLERIAQTQTLRICISPLRFGLTIRDWRTQELSGMDFELSQALAHSLGARATYVDSTYTSMPGYLERDMCDIAMFGLFIRPVPEGSINYSKPYLHSGVYAVSTKGNQTVQSWEDIDQPGVMVGILDGSFTPEWVKEHFRYATPVVIPTSSMREKELQAGRIDVFLTDAIYGRRVVDIFDWVRVIPPATDAAKVSFGYAVKAGDPEWLATINLFIDGIRQSGRLANAARPFGLLPMLEE